MPLEFGSLFNATANIRSSLGKEQSVKSFLNAITSMGLATKNMFEVNFDGLTEASFFCSDIGVPRIKTNTVEIYFAHQSVSLPVTMEFEHECELTLLSDCGGYFYSVLNNFLLTNSGPNYSAKGHTIIIKSLGDDGHYDGMTITMTGVRVDSIGSLSFSTSSTEILKFDIGLYVRRFDTTPGIAGKVSGITGAIGGLLG